MPPVLDDMLQPLLTNVGSILHFSSPLGVKCLHHLMDSGLLQVESCMKRGFLMLAVSKQQCIPTTSSLADADRCAAGMPPALTQWRLGVGLLSMNPWDPEGSSREGITTQQFGCQAWPLGASSAYLHRQGLCAPHQR